MEMLEERLAPAGTFTWIGSNANSNWSNGANWVGGVAPANNDSGDTLVFSTATSGFVGSTLAYSPTNDLTLTNLTINVTDSGTTSQGFTLSGNGVDVSGGGVSVSGTNAAGLETLALLISGTGGLTQAGSDTLLVSAANTYTGPTNINQGTVQAQNNTALGTGVVTVASGAVLQVIPGPGSTPGLLGQYYNIAPNSNNFVSLTALNNSLAGQIPALTAIAPPTLTSTNTFDFSTSGNGFPAPYTTGATNFEGVWTGNFNAQTTGTYAFDTGSDDGSMIFIDGNVVVNNNAFQGVTQKGGTVNLTAGLHSIVIAFYQGGGGYGLYADVTVPGGSSQRLPLSLLSYPGGSSTNLTIGSLTGGGSVMLGVFGALTLGTDNTNQTFSGVISGPNSVTKVGTGTQTLSGANTYNGPTAIQSGTIKVGAANTLPIGASVLLGNGTTGGTLDLNGQNQQIADLRTSGSGTNQVINSGAGTPVLTLAPSDTDTVSGILGAAGQNSFSVVMNGTGTLILSGTNTYTGTTSVTNGTLEAGANVASGVAGAFGTATTDILVGATSGSASANLLTGGAFTISRNITVQSGSSGTATVGGGTANTSTFADTITLGRGVNLSAVGGGLANFTGTITGPFTVSVSTGGIVQLSGANNYTGGTTVNAGTLNVTSPLSTVGPVIVNGGVLNANVASAVGAVTVTVNSSGTFQAAVANALNGTTVNVAGGSLVLGTMGSAGSATESFAAINLLFSGSMRVIAGGNLGSGTIAVGNGTIDSVAQLVFNPGPGNTVTYGGATIPVIGGSIQVQSGTVDLTSNNTVVAGTAVSTSSNVLQGLLYNAVGLGIFNDGAPILQRAPDQAANVTTAVSFPVAPVSTNTPFNNLFPGAPGVATAFFVGNFTPQTSGAYQFFVPTHDDDTIVWIDLNQDGKFEAGNAENVLQGGCCGGIGPSTAVNLVAGQTYLFAVGWDNTGGPGNVEVQFKGGAFTSFTDINPGSVAQAGLWSVTGGGASINVSAGATFKVGSVTGSPTVNLAPGAIEEEFFTGSPSQSFLNPINVSPGLLTQTPVVTKTLSGPLSFDQSNSSGVQLNAESGGVVGFTNFSALWQTTLTVATPGTWSFGTSSDDGSVIYINGTLVVNNNFFQANASRVGLYTFATAGQYSVVIGFYQGGGGDAMEARFAETVTNPTTPLAYGSQTIINPFDPSQAGLWSFPGGAAVFQLSSTAATTSSLGAVSLAGTNGSATINVGANNTVTATSLSIATSGTLTMSGVGATGGTFTVNGTETLGTGSTTNVTGGTTVFAAASTGTGAINVSGTGTLRITVAAGTASSSAVTVGSGGRFDVAVSNALLANVVVNAGGFLRLDNPQDTTAGATLPTAVMAGTLEINNVGIGPNFAGLKLGNGSTVTSLVAGATYASSLTLAGANVNFDTSGAGGSFTVSGVITDGGSNFGITKLGANTLTLSADNAYGGGTVLSAGTLLVANPTGSTAPLGLGTGTVTINGGTLDLRNDGTGSNQTITFGNNVAIGGTATINVDHVANNTGNTIALGGLTIGTQTLTITGGDTYQLSLGGTTLTGNSTISTSTANLTLGALGDGGTARTLTKNGTGTLTLSAAETGLVAGTQVIANAGILTLGNASATATAGALIVNTGARLDVAVANALLANVVVNAGGFLRLDSPQDSTAGATVPTAVMAGTLEINNAAIGPNFAGLKLGNGSTVTSLVAGATYASALVLGGSNVNFDTSGPGGSFVVSGSISDGGNHFGISKQGANTLTLTGNDPYSGSTQVNAGTLLVDGIVTSAVSVSNGSTLGGTGTVASITEASGGTVSPGDIAGSVTTFTTSGPAGTSLAGSVIIDLNGAGADAIKNTGAGAVSLVGATLTMNLVALGSFGQSYTLISSIGGITGTFSNAANGSEILLGGHVYRFVYTGSALTLSDEGTESLIFQQQPTTGVTDALLTPAPSIQLVDQAGQVVTVDTTRTITVSLGSNPSGGTLSGVLALGFSNGVATFGSVSIDMAGVGYTLAFNSTGLTGITSQAFTIFLPLALPPTLPPAMVGVPYQQPLITGGTPPFTVTLVAGALPPGLTLGPGATLSGTATTTGSFAFTLQITDATGAVVTQSFSFTVQLRTANATILVSGADAGGLPQVTVYNAQTMQLVTSFWAFPGVFTGGVRVAVGDVNGDGVPDIICGAGPGGGPQVNVYDGRTGQLIRSFFAMPAGFRGGVYVAAGDINGDGFADIIVGADAGGGPQVTVYSGKDGSVLMSFFAMPPGFTGGVRVAAGDMNGDGKADIITGAGPGGSPEVAIFDGATGHVLNAYFAFDPVFTGGVYVAFGNPGGTPEVVVGSGPGIALPLIPPSGISEPDASRVSFFDLSGTEQTSFLAFPPIGAAPFFVGGVRVGTILSNGNLEILTGAGPSGGPEMKLFNGGSLQALDDFFALPGSFTGGLFVAGG
jgi:autotransporter-associated beta strand protein